MKLSKQIEGNQQNEELKDKEKYNVLVNIQENNQ